MSAQSKLTSQGQISVPAEIRKKLGIGPGSVLAWEESNDQVIIRRVGRYSSSDVHAALFPGGGRKQGAQVNVKEGIKTHIRQKHARR